MDSGIAVVHVITIATKPDIIKQAPVYRELQRRGEQVLVCHTGQHYDDRYSGGMLEEFGLEIDVHLRIDGFRCTRKTVADDRAVRRRARDELKAPA